MARQYLYLIDLGSRIPGVSETSERTVVHGITLGGVSDAW